MLLHNLFKFSSKQFLIKKYVPEYANFALLRHACKSSKSSDSSKTSKPCGAASNVAKAKVGGNNCPKPSTKKAMAAEMSDCEAFEHHKPNSRKWRFISFSMMPIIALMTFLVFSAKHEHAEKYVPYEYLYRHTKRFPWGDGKLTYFHGPNNVIPGEEEK